jgi:hypothetical protein
MKTEIYFAIDEFNEKSLSDLCRIVHTTISQNSNLKIYALVDSSFDLIARKRTNDDWEKDGLPIYRNTEYQQAERYGPKLIALSTEVGRFQSEADALLKKYSGIPMLSFLASELDIISLAARFKLSVNITVDEEQIFILRFADTRITGVLDKILREQNEINWRSGVDCWWIPDRRANFLPLPSFHASNSIENKNEDTLHLSQNKFSDLVDLCELDAIIDAIFDQNSDLIRQKNPSEVYEVVSRLKTAARNFKITNFRDLIIFCTTALATNEFFYSQIDFQNILRTMSYTPGSLGTAFSDLNDSSWDDLDKNP